MPAIGKVSSKCESGPELNPPANLVSGRGRLEPHRLPVRRLDVLKVVKIILERAALEMFKGKMLIKKKLLEREEKISPQHNLHPASTCL